MVTIILKIVSGRMPPTLAPDGDPWGVPIIYPAVIVSMGALIIVSLLTKKPKPEELERFFPKKN